VAAALVGRIARLYAPAGLSITDYTTATVALGGSDFALDGGRLAPSAPSTVVDCTGRRPRVIRPGAISAETLRESVPDLIGDA
jgi:tRNA A37 threonylcarbamoyladenosine synthetase subunit TsaC/SUA5/YrdC